VITALKPIPTKLGSLGSRQRVVEAMEYNVSAIHDTLITQLIMHAQMFFIVWKKILNLSCQRFQLK